MNETRSKSLAFITYFSLFCAVAIIPITAAAIGVDIKSPTYRIIEALFAFCSIICIIAHTLLALVYLRLIQNSKIGKKFQSKWTIWLFIAPILVAPVLYAKHRRELEINS